MVHERHQQLEHVLPREAVAGRHGLSVLELEAAREDRQAAVELLLSAREQGVAGLDRGVERAAAEHREALVEPLGDRGRRQRAQAAGGELEREREPAEPPADRRHVAGVDLESGPGGGGALLEQTVGGGLAQRRDGDDRLAGHAERPPAGDEHADARSRRGEVADHRSELGHEVLAAVEDKQHVRVLQPLADDGERVAVPLTDAAQPERRGRGQHDVVSAPQRRELDQPRAARRVPCPRRLPGQCRLADAAGPDERHDPVLGQRRAEQREVLVPPDDARHPASEVARRRELVAPGRGRELVPQHERLELAKRGSGLQADLVQRTRQPPVGVERLGVASSVVQRPHEVAHRLLAQRVLGRESFQLGDRLLDSAGLREGCRPLSPERVADGVQPPRLGPRDLDAVEIAERLAAPQRERLVVGARLGQPAEASGVNHFRRDGEPVAGGVAYEHGRRSARRAVRLEERPQPREAHAQRSRGAGAPLLRPRGLDQLLGRHRHSGRNQQPCQQRPLDAARRRPSIDEHGSQHSELHRADRTPGARATSKVLGG